jgi:ADP-dependent NAD(P)H-hydrate dehydratase / NAD(P)H-hydrate epimerase
MDAKTVRAVLKKALHRKKDTHKGDCGRIFIIAGSPGLTGAATLSAYGALRCGAGLVTVGTPSSCNDILEIKLTEAMTIALAETREGTISPAAYEQVRARLKRMDVLAIGPGLSQNLQTKKLIRKIVINSTVPIVLDADGLNAFVDFSEKLAKIKSSVIITPHIGEFSRLFKHDAAYVKKNAFSCAKKASLKYGITVVLKGNPTIVASGKKIYLNNTGNPGLATGGTGDILTGMLAGLRAPVKDDFEAACSAVYLHGLAADCASKVKTQVALLASDVLDFIPAALQQCGIK